MDVTNDMLDLKPNIDGCILYEHTSKSLLAVVKKGLIGETSEDGQFMLGHLL